MNKKSLILAISLMLVFVFTMGTTIAFLQDSDNAVTNTFVAADIGDLDLSETDNDSDADSDKNEYLVVPGIDITKDPSVSFVPNENDRDKLVDAYVFVTMTADGWTTTDNENFFYKLGAAGEPAVDYGLSFSIADWTYLGKDSKGDYVYYVSVPKTDTLNAKPIITNNKIIVDDAITEDDLDAATNEGALTNLVFSSYAIQQAGFESDVWSAYTAVSGNVQAS